MPVCGGGSRLLASLMWRACRAAVFIFCYEAFRKACSSDVLSHLPSGQPRNRPPLFPLLPRRSRSSLSRAMSSFAKLCKVRKQNACFLHAAKSPDAKDEYPSSDIFSFLPETSPGLISLPCRWKNAPFENLPDVFSGKLLWTHLWLAAQSLCNLCDITCYRAAFFVCLFFRFVYNLDL